MSTYTAIVEWRRSDDAKFTDNRYSRAHTWRFDGGTEVRASSSPHVVPLPLSAADAVDPEEAFIAALSSCHMLFFLSIAAKRGFVVERYRDEAIGTLERNEAGRMAMTRVVLRPHVEYAGPTPDQATLDAIHHESHEQCFIANSVTTAVEVEPAQAAAYDVG